MKNKMVVILGLLMIMACGRTVDRFMPMAAEDSEEAGYYEKSDVSDEAPVIPEEPVIERKIIKEGWMRIEVEDYSVDLKSIKRLVDKHEGYLSNEYESSSDYSLNNSLSIRVPSTEFDSLVTDIIKAAKKVEHKNITLKDVTEEFVDIEARLKTKREVEERYLDILQKAVTVKDILLVEEQLRIIREEIEAREGRLKYLQSQVGFSTLNLEIYQDLSFQPGFRFFRKIGDALRGGWKGLLSVVVGLFYIWPILLIVIIIVVWFYRRRKRKLKKG
jgi:hypothetical protein